jgi:hypothetical protein
MRNRSRGNAWPAPDGGQYASVITSRRMPSGATEPLIDGQNRQSAERGI